MPSGEFIWLKLDGSAYIERDGRRIDLPEDWFRPVEDWVALCAERDRVNGVRKYVESRVIEPPALPAGKE